MLRAYGGRKLRTQPQSRIRSMWSKQDMEARRSSDWSQPGKKGRGFPRGVWLEPALTKRILTEVGWREPESPLSPASYPQRHEVSDAWLYDLGFSESLKMSEESKNVLNYIKHHKLGGGKKKQKTKTLYYVYLGLIQPFTKCKCSPL